MSDENTPQTAEELYGTRSGRRLTFWRRLGYRLVARLGWLVVELLWRTARLRVVGEEGLREALARHGAVVPVCWHQHLIICARYVASRPMPGLRTGFLISPSMDGEGPMLLAELYDAVVIRGSSTYTGTRALRQLSKFIRREQVSPLITPDGPRGPRFEFKGGALALAQMCDVPVVPLAFAARPVKIFGTWDKFVLPAPFARVVIVVGEPVVPPRKLSPADAEAMLLQMQQRMHAAFKQAKSILDSGK